MAELTEAARSAQGERASELRELAALTGALDALGSARREVADGAAAERNPGPSAASEALAHELGRRHRLRFANRVQRFALALGAAALLIFAGERWLDRPASHGESPFLGTGNLDGMRLETIAPDVLRFAWDYELLEGETCHLTVHSTAELPLLLLDESVDGTHFDLAREATADWPPEVRWRVRVVGGGQEMRAEGARTDQLPR